MMMMLGKVATTLCLTSKLSANDALCLDRKRHPSPLLLKCRSQEQLQFLLQRPQAHAEGTYGLLWT